jgi:hypothetical protein
MMPSISIRKDTSKLSNITSDLSACHKLKKVGTYYRVK